MNETETQEVTMTERFTDASLTAMANDTFNLGGARAARYLLAVPQAEREVRQTAGVIFHNTSPGWRRASAIGYACRQPLAWCERIVADERARAARERELRAQGHAVVVYHDGTVGHYGDDLMVTHVTKEV